MLKFEGRTWIFNAKNWKFLGDDMIKSTEHTRGQLKKKKKKSNLCNNIIPLFSFSLHFVSCEVTNKLEHFQ